MIDINVIFSIKSSTSVWRVRTSLLQQLLNTFGNQRNLELLVEESRSFRQKPKVVGTDLYSPLGYPTGIY